MVEEMVGTREVEAAAVTTESGRAVATESGGAATTGDETVATAGDETAATGVVMFTDEGELEFDEDEMAALEGQRLIAELEPLRRHSAGRIEPSFRRPLAPTDMSCNKS